jgi:hypothetical protein
MKNWRKVFIQKLAKRIKGISFYKNWVIKRGTLWARKKRLF